MGAQSQQPGGTPQVMRYCDPPASGGQVGARERVLQRWPTKARHNPGRVPSGKSSRPKLAKLVIIPYSSPQRHPRPHPLSPEQTLSSLITYRVTQCLAASRDPSNGHGQSVSVWLCRDSVWQWSQAGTRPCGPEPTNRRSAVIDDRAPPIPPFPASGVTGCEKN